MNTGCTTSQMTRPKGIIGTVSLMDTESSLTGTREGTSTATSAREQKNEAGL